MMGETRIGSLRSSLPEVRQTLRKERDCMKLKRINTIYFSPTGGTAEIVRFIARELAALLHLEERKIDLTRPENRKMQLQMGCDELLIMASPVYAGRLPNKLLPDYHALLHGEGDTGRCGLHLWQPKL